MCSFKGISVICVSLVHWPLTFSGVVCILSLQGRQEQCPFTTRLRGLKLEHFRRKRNDLHEVSFAQFARNRAKDTCASWIITSGNNHGSVLVKTDMRTIRPRILLCHA